MQIRNPQVYINLSPPPKPGLRPRQSRAWKFSFTAIHDVKKWL